MTQDTNAGYVKEETHNSITTIEFFHPHHNALPAQLMSDLVGHIYAASIDTGTKVIVLRSGGSKSFCAGASFDELLALRNEADGLAFFSGFAGVINAMRTCSKLIIGRIQGNCVGGGVGIAAATDYCIAWEEVSVRLSELSNGLAPLVIGPAVERKIGLSAFSQLSIDATMWRNADWAKRKGLFAEVHPSIENMDESINRLAHSLAHDSLEAMTALKKMLWRDTDHWNELLTTRALLSGRLAMTETTKNALLAFKLKGKNGRG